MNLSPEIIEAMRSQYDVMGFGFDPEALSQFKSDGPDVVGLASAMGLSPAEIATLLIEKFTVAHIEHELPKCVREFNGAALISMPLDDLRFIHGYLALVEAGASITSDATKRALEISCKLANTAEPKAEVKKHRVKPQRRRTQAERDAAKRAMRAMRASAEAILELKR